jgi:spermidine synthase
MIEIPIRQGETELWMEDRHRDILGMRFRVKRVLFSGKSPYQHVEILETAGLGRMLLNDGIIMITERDEFVYHEMIAHVPLFTHRGPERVLVVGGGDGGTAREVLRHPGVKVCRMVEIDEMVVDACREFIPQTAASLDDPRLELTIADAVEFVAETDERFDVVLIDSTDPIGPAKPLFGEAFYRNLRRILGDGGLVVSQGESPFYEGEAQKMLLGTLNQVFDHTHAYNFTNMTYPGGLWSFTFASDGPCPMMDLDQGRVAASGIDFKYYSPEVHRAAFALPQFMRDNLEGLIVHHD